MSLSPLIIGHEGGAWWESGVCWAPIAGAAAPRVKPPANAAPFLSSALRFSGFEPMRLSFEDEAQRGNRSAAESIRPSRVGLGGSPGFPSVQRADGQSALCRILDTRHGTGRDG